MAGWRCGGFLVGRAAITQPDRFRPMQSGDVGDSAAWPTVHAVQQIAKWLKATAAVPERILRIESALVMTGSLASRLQFTPSAETKATGRICRLLNAQGFVSLPGGQSGRCQKRRKARLRDRPQDDVIGA